MIRTDHVPVEVVVRDGHVQAIRCAVPAADGAAGGTSADIAAATILVAIGEEPDPSILPEGTGIEISGWAGIVADPRTLATGRAGVFAGGDVVSGPKTIIDAVAAGRRAAASIHELLANVADGDADILRVVRYATAAEPELTLDLGVRPRTHAPLPVVDPWSFAPTQLGLDTRAARSEAARCFRCDAIRACDTAHVTAGRGPADRAESPALATPTGGAQ